MKPVLIIKTGITVKAAYDKAGDFERWIIDSMLGNAADFIVAEVFKGDSLPDSTELAGVVITGSAAMVTERLPWSEYTAEWLRQAVNKQVPILGICYGHQLLAHALGGRVDFHPGGREIGTTVVTPIAAAGEDELFASIKSPFTAHVSHMQSVIELPANATILACNEFEPHQAVKYSKHVWGLQFHPEFEEIIMLAYMQERAAVLIEEGLDLEQLRGKVSPTPIARKILADFYTLIKNYSV
tara:strand:+ start:1955 stop:2677 length:723 start_codon:yes stop_codon:yes gene_type:complete